MSNIILSYKNRIDAYATSLTASSSAGGMSIQNVADPRIGRRWRCTESSCWGQANFRTNVAIDTVALVFPRDTTLAAGTVTHAFDADGGTPGAGVLHSSGAVDIGAVEGYGYHVYRLPALVSARYWRWTYALTSAYADTGRAWAGTGWSPRVNYDVGASDSWGDLSSVSTSKRSGADFVDEKNRQRLFTFNLSFMDDDDQNFVREMRRVVGISKQILCIKNPADAARETLIGRITTVSPIVDANVNVASSQFSVRESL